MTQFLDCRLNPVGGELSTMVAVNQGAGIADYTGLALSDLLSAVQGQHVLIATHGFNVNRADGVASLSNWESLLQLPAGSAFVGLLWPGDSVWAHGLDYPGEPRVADQAGTLLGPFIDATFAEAASVSFASHSLGARVVLETITNMQLPVRRVTLMAGAVDDDCLTGEFQTAVAKIEQLSILASKKDEVLSFCFPAGNFFAGIIAAGHPWWRGALGHGGPNKPLPSNVLVPFAIPDGWNYQHSNYLEICPPPPPAPVLPIPTNVPANGAPYPANQAPGWSAAFTAAFVSTRFR